MSTRGLSTATLEKAAKAKKEAEAAAEAAKPIEDEIEDLPDEHLDELPFEDDGQVEASHQQATASMKELDERMQQALNDTTSKLAEMRAKFKSTLQKHVTALEQRGLHSNLTQKVRATPAASKRLHDLSLDLERQTQEQQELNSQQPDGLALSSKSKPSASPSKRSEKQPLASPTTSLKSSPFQSPLSTSASSSSQQTPRPQLSQTARLHPSDAPIVLSTPLYSSPGSDSRPSTARPASATRPRQRLEQAKLFSDSVYGSGTKSSSQRLEFDSQPNSQRDELTGEILPAALTKHRATSAPYRPQHAKPSFTQPAQPLSPITQQTASSKQTDRPQKQRREIPPTAIDSDDVDPFPPRPSSVASTTSNSSLTSNDSTISSNSPASTKSTASSSSATGVRPPSRKKTSSIPTSSVAAAAASASASSALFASPFAHIKPVPLTSVGSATSTASTSNSANPTNSIGSNTRSAAALSQSERAAAAVAATKAALAEAKKAAELKSAPTTNKSLPTTRGVNINTNTTKTKQRAPTITQQQPPTATSSTPSQFSPSLKVTSLSTQPSASISANRPNIPVTPLSPSSAAASSATNAPKLQSPSAAQQVRQQLLAAKKFQAPLEEIDLNNDDDAADENSQDLDGNDEDDQDQDDDTPSLFARPWSAHQRAEHSVLNSARGVNRDRPMSAARRAIHPYTGGEDGEEMDTPYASFSLPLHETNLTEQLQNQIHVSNTYAKAFAATQQSKQQSTPTNRQQAPTISQRTQPPSRNPFLLNSGNK